MVAGPCTAKHLRDHGPDRPVAAKDLTLLLLPPPPPVPPPPSPPPAAENLENVCLMPSTLPAQAAKVLNKHKPSKRIYYVHMTCGGCETPLSFAVYTSVSTITHFEGLLTKDFTLLCPSCEKRYG